MTANNRFLLIAVFEPTDKLAPTVEYSPSGSCRLEFFFLLISQKSDFGQAEDFGSLATRIESVRVDRRFGGFCYGEFYLLLHHTLSSSRSPYAVIIHISNAERVPAPYLAQHCGLL